MNRRVIIIVIETAIIILLLGGWLVWWLSLPGNFLSPISEKLTPRPLLAYTFTALRQTQFPPVTIFYDSIDASASGQGYTSWLFHYESAGKRVSGLANLPVGVSTASGQISVPVILMLHGSVDAGFDYYAGFGTQPVGAVLARNGYATFAPDYLDFGTSGQGGPDPFLDRFQTYTTNLTLLASLERVCSSELVVNSKTTITTNNSQLSTNNCRIGIWGHSNGGQIGLSVLEISSKSYPTVLWNPVSEGFPYNILYYTNTYADHGKWLRAALAKFETLYDVENYSTPNFLSWINAPILLQQAGADEWVPPVWSDHLNAALKSDNKQISYKTYPGADHNMQPGWNQAVTDTLVFFKSKL